MNSKSDGLGIPLIITFIVNIDAFYCQIAWLMGGFTTVNANGVLLFFLCLIDMAFLQNMSPNMEKNIEPCAF